MDSFQTTWAPLLYLVAGILFILALRGLSSPATSRAGNRNGMIGMAIAAVTTLVLIAKLKSEFLAIGAGQSSVAEGMALIFGALVVGGGIGTICVALVFARIFPQLRGVDSLAPEELIRKYR